MQFPYSGYLLHIPVHIHWILHQLQFSITFAEYYTCTKAIRYTELHLVKTHVHMYSHETLIAAYSLYDLQAALYHNQTQSDLHLHLQEVEQEIHIEIKITLFIYSYEAEIDYLVSRCDHSAK